MEMFPTFLCRWCRSTLLPVVLSSLSSMLVLADLGQIPQHFQTVLMSVCKRFCSFPSQAFSLPFPCSWVKWARASSTVLRAVASPDLRASKPVAADSEVSERLQTPRSGGCAFPCLRPQWEGAEHLRSWRPRVPDLPVGGRASVLGLLGSCRSERSLTGTVPSLP